MVVSSGSRKSQSSGGPGRLLPSVMMLDPPGQRLKVPDGPSVEPRRLSEYCLGNMEIDERVLTL